MKRKLLCVILTLCALGAAACGERPAKPAETERETVYFQAEVLEVSENSLLVEPLEGTTERGSADRIWVTVNAPTAAREGDTVEIGYDGILAESYPAQIASASVRVTEEGHWDRIPMVMVNGKLYYDTGRESTEARCGNMDGKIDSSVEGWETPTEDNQSNFGTGYGYQYGQGNTIEIYMNEHWWVFEQRSGDGSTVLFQGKQYSTGDLSEETLEWLNWYNGLSEEEQRAVDAIPAELAGAEKAEAHNAEGEETP